MHLFTIDNLKMELGGREVLDIPHLQIPDGEIAALTGPNGSGKTSLLMLLGGLYERAAGRVRYREQDLSALSGQELDRIRRDLGMVLQSPYLFKTTVLKNVCYGLVRRGIARSDAARKAREALAVVGLAGFGERSHSALSGGEAQRVALARALVLKPEVLLLDEPFANVDAVSKSIIERVLVQENRHRKTSIVYTTHDLDQAYTMADTVITLYGGKVQEHTMENLYHGTIRFKSIGAVFDTGRMEISIPWGRTSAMTATIPPEAIILSRSPISTSARNIHHGRITAVRQRNGTIEVVVDAGEPIVSRITEKSYRELGLMLGQEVYLIFKAEAVRLN